MRENDYNYMNESILLILLVRNFIKEQFLRNKTKKEYKTVE